MVPLYHWEFPLPRPHTGMLLGDAIVGAMIWGNNGVLRVTLGRSDWWDHRGGLHWGEQQSYANIRRCLEANDKAGLQALFAETPRGAGQPARPSLLPVGRFEIDLGPKAELLTGQLNTRTGVAEVHLRIGSRKHVIRLTMDMSRPVIAIRLPAGQVDAVVRAIPAWDVPTAREQLEAISFSPPERIDARGLVGWVQPTPADRSCCALARRDGRDLLLTAELAENTQAARKAAEKLLAQAARGDAYAGAAARAQTWWAQYLAHTPDIDIPHETLAKLHEYGLYKFAGLTQPKGYPAGLQGPWIEDYRLPPWSGDYHFNINVQMCYWPAYAANRLGHLQPLWDLIFSWEPVLRHNAKAFLGIDDGLMLPHAVDDRCTCMGGFWTGSIDHGCTAWIAQMMYRHYLFTGDETFLRDRAYPFMYGAMRVYEEMLERQGDSFVLPVSVSPEYRGAAMNAWGRNASFQLACIHRLCEDLQAASRTLGLEPRPIWSEIAAKLPKACLGKNDSDKIRIFLWEGTNLQESHRHHSHLAGLVPFDIIDWEDPAWRDIVNESLREWVFRGPGMWSGWCIPWASMLHSRVGNGAMAATLLELGERFFTNEGHGTLHDAGEPGLTLMGRGPLDHNPPRLETMQMDLGMCMVVAVQEMLLHCKRGVHHVFRGVPRDWKTASFQNMLTEGGFLVSAKRRSGRTASVRVTAQRAGVFRLANPFGDQAAVIVGRKKTRLTGSILEIPLRKGQSAEIGQP